ncbi:hypothetical protein Tco_0194412 [Tanacetum coccineum]
MGDSMQLFQQQFEAFMKRYSEDQQRIQSQFEEIRQENTHNSATREPRVNRLNEEGLDRGSGGTGNTNRRCKLDFPRYDGSTDPLPWMSHWIAHIWTGRSLRTIVADDLVLMVVVIQKMIKNYIHRMFDGVSQVVGWWLTGILFSLEDKLIVGEGSNVISLKVQAED